MVISYRKIPKGRFMITIDANTAVAKIAYKLSEVIPVYPITPSTPMAEFCTAKASKEEKNIFGEIVKTIEMQSEAGVAGTLHGALLSGALSTTFTCSQGLLLMIPNMYKIAGEGLPAVIHTSARAISSHALSIFGDHSDVMATRQTGFSIICSSNVQEAHDMALISHVCACKYNMPILHFFDGFRTSHEIQKIEEISDEVILKIFPKNNDISIKQVPLSPENPKMFGTAQNPDVFFQNKEANTKKYNEFSQNLQRELLSFYKLTGRKYAPFEYYGPQNPKNLIISMASSTETIEETLDCLKSNTGLIKVRLYRPFDAEFLLNTIPASVKKICVLDKTREFGGENPLFLDVSGAIIRSGKKVEIISGRYGLGGKEFSPASVKAIIDNLEKIDSKKDFNVGINDDLLNSSLEISEYTNDIHQREIKIFGLGSDGSVSASKNLIKILGENTNEFVQGFFEYDSKKAGSLTISHLRLSNKKIRSSYLLKTPEIICINNFSFVHRYKCLEGLKNGGIVIINSVFNKDEIDKVLPNSYKEVLKDKNAKLFIINAQKIAKENGLNEKINIIMLAALFKATNIIDISLAVSCLEKEIKSTFIKKGKEVVENNLNAMNEGFNEIQEVDVKDLRLNKNEKVVKKDYPNSVMEKICNLDGNFLPVSAFTPDGSMSTDTAKFEKRGIAQNLPIWLPENCIQCGKCVLACPHGALKAILIDEKDEPSEKNMPFADAIGLKGQKFRIQLSPEDCTGCGVCFKTCPAMKKAIEMALATKTLDAQKKNYDISNSLQSKEAFNDNFPKGLQFKKSYFAFPGACAGCGETPYIKLASMLFGEKMIIANATGCSSIYCGSFPSCPFSKDVNGHGPAWANSLFEDNAEFGLGLKLGSKYVGNEDKSVWIIGGDGWANDIGFGGIDHVLQTNENVNILVLDNEVYSNTGGQASKATPLGAHVKFAESGKKTKKKNLGLIAMSYKNAYVAQVSLGADMNQCIKAFKEAESFNGPSIIIAYSPCVEHGFDMSNTMLEMEKAVKSGYWNLFRYNPNTGLTLDSDQKIETKEFLKGERRFSQNQDENLLEKESIACRENLEILKFLASKK